MALKQLHNCNRDNNNLDKLDKYRGGAILLQKATGDLDFHHGIAGAPLSNACKPGLRCSDTKKERTKPQLFPSNTHSLSSFSVARNISVHRSLYFPQLY